MCTASGGPGSHFLSPLTPRLLPTVALFNPRCCSALTFLTKSSPSLSLPLHSSLFRHSSFTSNYYFIPRLVSFLHNALRFDPLHVLGCAPAIPSTLPFSLWFSPFLFARWTHPPPPPSAPSLPLPRTLPNPLAEQPGRAPTWCTTTCWPTWTGPAWTRRAAAAACRGRSSPPTCRRTRTMTPSGRATVTGWARCRARAASPTRTKETWLYCHAAL